MNDSEIIKMSLNIGDQLIWLSVPVARQNFVRNVEAGVNSLFSKWRQQFPTQTDREILAMVAYQYASFYGELKARFDKAADIADECLDIISADKTDTHVDDVNVP